MSTTRRCCSTSAAPRMRMKPPQCSAATRIAVKRASMHTDFGDPGDVVRVYLPRLAPNASFLTPGASSGDRGACADRTSCRGIVARTARSRRAPPSGSGLGRGVAAGLTDIYEQWDGKGVLDARGDSIALAARSPRSPSLPRFFMDWVGLSWLSRPVRRRAGAALDPDLVGRCRAHRVHGSWACSESTIRLVKWSSPSQAGGANLLS